MGTLVYGLNIDFHIYREWIEENYEVTGYYDADKTRMPEDKGINLDVNPELIHTFDMVLVCADPVSIVADLKEKFDFPISRIKILFYELLKSKHAIQQFNGSYSEDAVLMLLMLKIRKRITQLRYLEIGTNDPVRANNTFSFYEAGARGVLVDPLPIVGDLVNMIRPEDRYINAAISETSGDAVSFYACKSSTVSSLKEEHHEKWNGMSHKIVHEKS
ncbi:hypothetical protein [Butyrivibrio sp. JL13D10]|uniref:hypothetical protein n=1 Tax=Butyrivibrio sp. JL13D10 TaxID=3236815 RepID=UPI0038B46D7C